MTTTTQPPAQNTEQPPTKAPRAPRVLASVGGQNLSLIGALALVLTLFGTLNDNYLSLTNLQV
ncbi:ABC transporter permease, partial [Kitasatospora sp. NPDC057015]